jgi:hypothetical protein
MTDITITQANREAYALEVERLGDKEYADLVRAGKRDTLSILGMLARHRHEARAEALEEAAKVADQYSASRRSASAHAKDQKKRTEARDFESMAIEGTHIATAIRALRTGSADGRG